MRGVAQKPVGPRNLLVRRTRDSCPAAEVGARGSASVVDKKVTFVEHDTDVATGLVMQVRNGKGNEAGMRRSQLRVGRDCPDSTPSGHAADGSRTSPDAGVTRRACTVPLMDDDRPGRGPSQNRPLIGSLVRSEVSGPACGPDILSVVDGAHTAQESLASFTGVVSGPPSSSVTKQDGPPTMHTSGDARGGDKGRVSQHAETSQGNEVTRVGPAGTPPAASSTNAAVDSALDGFVNTMSGHGHDPPHTKSAGAGAGEAGAAFSPSAACPPPSRRGAKHKHVSKGVETTDDSIFALNRRTRVLRRRQGQDSVFPPAKVDINLGERADYLTQSSRARSGARSPWTGERTPQECRCSRERRRPAHSRVML